MSRIAACLVAPLLIAAAFAGSATPASAATILGHHHHDEDRRPEHELRFDVETDRLIYRPHDPITITVSVHNPNPHPVTLHFPTTHQAGYVMDDRYDWAHDKFFLMILTHVEVPARGSHAWRFRHDWDAYAPNGASSVVGYVVGQGRSDPAHFRVMDEHHHHRHDVPPRGDMNRDGHVDTADVADFVLALTDPAAYEHRHGFDPAEVGDINQDGAFDTADVAAFVEMITGNGHDAVTDAEDMLNGHAHHTSVPEPGTLGMLSLASLVLLRRHRRR